MGCSDPPPPVPPVSLTPSTARYVEWHAESDPVDRPVVLVVDTPGGPVDRLVADPDVTTFLNDRFHPVFRVASPGQPVGSVRFYTATGCPLTPPEQPADPAAFIRLANEVILEPAAHEGHRERLTLICVKDQQVIPRPFP